MTFVYGLRTSNNQFEYLTLFQGLKLVQARKVRNLIDIGDSLNIIQQMRSLTYTKLSSLNRGIDKIQRIVRYLNSMEYFHVLHNHNSQVDCFENKEVFMEQSMLCKIWWGDLERGVFYFSNTLHD